MSFYVLLCPAPKDIMSCEMDTLRLIKKDNVLKLKDKRLQMRDKMVKIMVYAIEQ